MDTTQLPVTSPDVIAATTPAPASEPEYKIIKVRKPDGTIKKVRRRVDGVKAPEAGAPTVPKAVPAVPSDAVPTSSTSQENPSKPSEPAAIKPTAPPAAKPTVKDTVPAAIPKASKPAASTKPVVSTSAAGPPEKATTATKSAEPSERPALNVNGRSTYRLFRNLHKLHRNVNAVAGTLIGDDGYDADDADPDSGSDNDSDSDNDSNDSDQGDKDNHSTKAGRKSSDTIHSAHSSDQDVTDNEKDNDKEHTGGASSRLKSATRSAVRPRPVAKAAAAEEVQVNEKEISSVDSPDKEKAIDRAAKNLDRRTTRLAQVIIWSIMVLIPILFLVLGILTAVMTGQAEDSSLGTSVSQANKIAVSLWPIVFAAIMAQTLRMFASYKVERGIRLMTLEQLINSHSLASALKQPFFLQRMNWLSIILLCIWALSPLAGQALLRMSYVGPGGSPTTVLTGYLDTTYLNIVYRGGNVAQDANLFTPQCNGLYSASLLATTAVQESPLDSWNNPKIPIFEELEAPESTGWSAVGSNPVYSSMLGIPFQNLTTNGTSEMVILSSYLYTTCSFLNNTNMSVIAENKYQFDISPSKTLQLNFTTYFQDSVEYISLPGTVTFASEIYQPSTGLSTYAYSQCHFSQSFVNSHLTCNGNLCVVDKMQRAPTPSTTLSISPIFGQAFVNVSASSDETEPSLTETYIFNPPTVDKINQQVDISTVPLNLFTQRFGLLFNSLLQCGYSPTFQTGGLNPNDTTGEAVAATKATYTNTTPVYITNWGWLVVLLVSSVILLVAGAAGAIFDAQTIGPDILGFASSIVRSSRFKGAVPEKVKSSATGAAERARALGDMKVMLQDVKAGKEVGKIALAPVGEGAEPLKRGRLYK